MPRSPREFDIVVFGATGFTGQLVAEYLATKPNLKWAIAGRDASKLNSVVSQLTPIAKNANGVVPKVLLANSKDASSLASMAKSTKVVISTVGPFTLYGEPLVKACAENSTDYVDITGEATWHKVMIDKYNDIAERNNSIIIPQCGFDSIPSDLGTYFLVDHIKSQYKTGVKSVQGNFSLDGGGSGGTAASAIAIMETPGAPSAMNNPYLLNPPNAKPSKVNPFEKSVLFPSYNSDLKRWNIPFFMAATNTKVVRRSHALFAASGDYYGTEFGYNEVWSFNSLFMALVTWIGLAVGFLLIALPFTRPIAKKILPSSGEGPNAERRARSWFKNVLVAETDRGQKVRAQVTGGCPGYGETAKMVSEAALTLVEERDQLRVKGGLSTPAVALGKNLIVRLNRVGIKFEILPENKKSA